MGMPQGSYSASGKKQTAEHTHFPQNSSRKEKGQQGDKQKIGGQTNKVGLAKKNQAIHTSVQIQFGGTSRFDLKPLEAGAVLWQVWKQYFCQQEWQGSGGRKKVLHRLPKLKASGPNAVHYCQFFITLFPSGTEKFLKDVSRYLS